MKAFFSQGRALNIEIYSELLRYKEGYARQKELYRQVAAGARDHIMLLEHRPVYTVGKRSSSAHFLVPPDTLRSGNVDVEKIDRGGQLTFHGPGQIILYAICNLGNRARDIRSFVFFLEETVIGYLRNCFGVDAVRRRQYPGVWVGNGKIAALGISIHNRTTMHGLAVNISTDLSFFDAIVPCGIKGGEVCSLRSVLQSSGGTPPDHALGNFNLTEEKQNLARVFAGTLGYDDLTLTHARVSAPADPDSSPNAERA